MLDKLVEVGFTALLIIAMGTITTLFIAIGVAAVRMTF